MPTPRIPPHDEDAEQAVLGSLLIDHEIMTIVSGIVKPDYFYNATNKTIFEYMSELYEARNPIDILTLTNLLKKKKMYEKVGGASYLTSLANVVPSSSNITHYAQILREHFIRRSLIQTGAEITDLAFQEERDSGEILDKVEKGTMLTQQLKTLPELTVLEVGIE